MAFQIWFSLSLLFLIRYLILLIDESYSINYLIVEEGDKLYHNRTNYLICTPFSEIKYYDQLKDETKVEDVSIESFLNYSKKGIEHRLNTTNLFKLNESYIFLDNICFLTNKSELEKEIPLNGYLKFYMSYLFIYSGGKQPFFNEYIYFKTDGLDSFYLKTYKQKVYGMQYLKSSSNCFTYNDQLASNKYHCLNNCFKKFKTDGGFYNLTDEKKFNLNHIVNQNKNQLTPQISNEIKTKDILKSCLTKCPENDCFWETYNTIRIDHDYYNKYLIKEGRYKVDLQTNIYLAFYSVNDFYAQLFGLISLLTGATSVGLLTKIINLSINRTIIVDFLSKIINWPIKKVKCLTLLYKYLKYLKYLKANLVIVFICLILVLVQSALVVNDYKLKSAYPNKTSALTLSSEQFSIVVCFPIYEANDKILKTKNLSHIEKETESEFKKRVLFNIFYGPDSIKFNWKFSKKAIFKSSVFNNETCLTRCFRMEFEIEDLKYKTISPLSILKMYFSNEYRQVYVIEKNQPFTSNLTNFNGVFYVRKKSIISFKDSKKSNCNNYSEIPNSKCSNRKHCIDQCIYKKFYDQYNSLTIYSVIDKDEFKSEYNLTDVKFNKTKDSKIESDCIDSFDRPDCNDVSFEESPQLSTNFYKDYASFLIKLNHEHLIAKEFKPSLIKLALDLINLLSIFFGLTAAGILLTVLSNLKKFLKTKWFKFLKIFIMIICLIGFLLHNALISHSIIEGDLVINDNFTRLDKFNLPNIIFCFQYHYETKIDKNTKITGEYLDELTSDLTFKHIFNSIYYFNKTHEKLFDFNELEYSIKSKFYSDSEIVLTHFYYLRLKCFEIKIKPTFQEKDFYFKEEKELLKIVLNQKLYKYRELVFLMCKQSESKQIGGSFVHRIGKTPLGPYYKHTYSIDFELFEIKKEDNFLFLKDPLSSFNQKTDSLDYLGKMKQKFKDSYGLASRQILLDEDFKLEIDDLLFEQFYLQIQKFTDLSGLTFSNYKQNAYNIYSQTRFRPLYYPDFTFSSSLVTRKVDIFNEDNFTKLVISILNALSFWLGLCILDLSVYVNRLFRPILHLYQLLIEVKLCLRFKIRNNLIPQNSVTIK